MENKEITWERVNDLIDRLPDGELKERVENIQNHFIEMAENPAYTPERALLDFSRQLQIDRLAGSLYNADRDWIDVFDVTETPVKNYEEIAEGLGFANVDELFGTNGFQSMNAQELKARLERLEPGVPYEKMMSYLTNGQIQHRRELLLEGYDEDGRLKPLNWAASALQGIFTPRVKEAYLRGDDPEFRDYLGDIFESATMAVPAGAFRTTAARAFGSVANKMAPKVASKMATVAANTVAKASKSPVASKVANIGKTVADNAASPALAQGYDYMMYDDPTNWRSQTDGWDNSRTITGTTINVMTPRMVRAFGQGVASKLTDAAGRTDRKFVDFISRGLANLGRDKDAEIAEAAMRRANILKRVPQRGDELTTADIRRWANEAAEQIPTEQEYANALTETAVSDWIDNVDRDQLSKIMANSSPENEIRIPTSRVQAGTVTPKDFGGFVKTPTGAIMNPATSMPMVETSTTAKTLGDQIAAIEREYSSVYSDYTKTGDRAKLDVLNELKRKKQELTKQFEKQNVNARANPMLGAEGTISTTPVKMDEANRTIKTTIDANPDLQAKISRVAGRTTPTRDHLNLIGGSYLTNQIGGTMYANNVGGVQAMGAKMAGESGNGAKEQKEARETVLRSMNVPKSHERIFRQNPRAYLQWRRGFRPKDLTPEQLAALDATRHELLVADR